MQENNLKCVITDMANAPKPPSYEQVRARIGARNIPYEVPRACFIGDFTLKRPTLEAILSEDGFTLSIWPHKVWVKDAIGAFSEEQYVRYFNLSRARQQLTDFTSNQEGMRKWVKYRPHVTVINMGFFDIIQENVTWDRNPNKFLFADRLEAALSLFEEKAARDVGPGPMRAWSQHHVFLVLSLPHWVKFQADQLAPGGRNIMDCVRYQKLRRLFNKGLAQRNKRLWDRFRAVMVAPNIPDRPPTEGTAMRLSVEGRRWFSAGISNAIGRVVCITCKLRPGCSCADRQHLIKPGQGCGSRPVQPRACPWDTIHSNQAPRPAP